MAIMARIGAVVDDVLTDRPARRQEDPRRRADGQAQAQELQRALSQPELRALAPRIRTIATAACTIVGARAVPNAMTGLTVSHRDLVNAYLIAACDDRRMATVPALQLLQAMADAVRCGLRPGLDSRIVVDQEARQAHAAVMTLEQPEALRALADSVGVHRFRTGVVCEGDIVRLSPGEPVAACTHERPAERGAVQYYYAAADDRVHVTHVQTLAFADVLAKRRTAPRAWHRGWGYLHTIGEGRVLADLLGTMMPELAHHSRIRAWCEPTSALAPHRSLSAARAMWLPGKRSDFEGHGGRAVRDVPTPILRGVRRWLRADAARLAQRQDLLVAVACELMLRRLQAGDSTSEPRAHA